MRQRFYTFTMAAVMAAASLFPSGVSAGQNFSFGKCAVVKSGRFSSERPSGGDKEDTTVPRLLNGSKVRTISESFSMGDVPVSATQKRGMARNGSCEITLSHPGEGEYVAQFVFVGNEESGTGEVVPANGQETVVSDLDAGTYTIGVIFTAEVDGCPIKFVTESDIEVKGGERLVFDPATATELVSVRSLTPEGLEMRGPLVDEKWNPVDDGNATVYTGDGFPGYFCNYLLHRDFGLVTYFEGSFMRLKDGDKINEAVTSGDFMFSPGASDRFQVSHAAIEVSVDGKTAYMVSSSSDGVKAQTVSNDYKQYAMTRPGEIFTTEYYNSDIVVAERDLFFGFETIIKGMPAFQMYGQGPLFADATDYAYCVPSVSGDVSAPLFDISMWASPYLKSEDIEDAEFIVTPVNAIYPALMRQRGKSLESIVTPMIDGYYGCDLFYDSDWKVSWPLVADGNPFFAFATGSGNQLAGSSVPLTYFKDRSYPGFFAFSFDALDRTGAAPTVDYFHPTRIQMSYGDETLDSEYSDERVQEAWDFIADFNSQINTFKGRMSLRLTNQGTFVFDGVPMRSVMESTRDYSREDNIPPTLTMLQFRDLDGNVRERFDDASQGVVNISAADMEYSYEVDMEIMAVKSFYTYVGCPEVKVEYAPLNSYDWREIAMENVGDKFFMPGYGDFFTGSLAAVDCMSPGGWFDLRISLRDASGNEQMSMISPAFRVEKLDGIGSIDEDVAADQAPVYFNIQGVRIAAPQAGQLCIVRRGDKVTKEIIN